MRFAARQNRRIGSERISRPSRTLRPGMFSFDYYVRPAIDSTRLAQGYQNVDVLHGMLTGTRYKNTSQGIQTFFNVINWKQGNNGSMKKKTVKGFFRNFLPRRCIRGKIRIHFAT